MTAELKGWGEHEVPEGPGAVWEAGPLRLRLRRSAGELHVVPDRARVGREPRGPFDWPPEAGAPVWSRWAVGGVPPRVAVLPVLPDRPLVVQPEHPFHLPPGERARVYVRVPVWARLCLAASTRPILLEVPTVVLSNTSFGGYTECVLCYWCPTTARRTVEPELWAPHLVVCPLDLTNLSPVVLPVARLCLPVRHLGIYRQADRLWADPLDVRLPGATDPAEIRPSGTPPREAEGATLLSPPRETTQKGLTGWTFSALQALPGAALQSLPGLGGVKR
ncbi:MAG: hypothetical protein HY722_01450 [Planctomycetes bacterium]|nr:hypothetical protein [Planctomycetota bacterium]